jgi:hypothetical protein
MNSSNITLLIVALVLISTIAWYLNTNNIFGFQEIISFGVIAILIGFGFFIGLSQLKSEKRGEPVEDELSKKIMQKASSLSFYISICFWLAVGYFSDKTDLASHTLIGAGILGMAVIFFICWIIIRFKGIKDV